MGVDILSLHDNHRPSSGDLMQPTESQVQGIERAYADYVQFNEAKEKMHAVSKAFRALVNHTDLKNALYSLDEGTAYVKRMYHSGEDDILRRAE